VWERRGESRVKIFRCRCTSLLLVQRVRTSRVTPSRSARPQCRNASVTKHISDTVLDPLSDQSHIPLSIVHNTINRIANSTAIQTNHPISSIKCNRAAPGTRITSLGSRECFPCMERRARATQRERIIDWQGETCSARKEQTGGMRNVNINLQRKRATLPQRCSPFRSIAIAIVNSYMSNAFHQHNQRYRCSNSIARKRGRHECMQSLGA
jgi:hypothetical protein